MKGQKRKPSAPVSTLYQNGLGFESSNASSCPNDSGTDEDDVRKKKKVRTTFTGRQIFELEKMFENKKYLSSSERSEMAKLLNVTEQQVKIWFQNRRTKWKKQENISNAEAAELMKSKNNISNSKEGQKLSSSSTRMASRSNTSSPKSHGEDQMAISSSAANGLSALISQLSHPNRPIVPALLAASKNKDIDPDRLAQLLKSQSEIYLAKSRTPEHGGDGGQRQGDAEGKEGEEGEAQSEMEEELSDSNENEDDNRLVIADDSEEHLDTSKDEQTKEIFASADKSAGGKKVDTEQQASPGEV